MNNYIHSIKIGNIELNNNVFLAPMAGISDMPFRILCKENGARTCLYRND